MLCLGPMSTRKATYTRESDNVEEGSSDGMVVVVVVFSLWLLKGR